MSAGLLRLFPTSFPGLAACGKSKVVSIKMAFPSVPWMPSAFCPSVTGFHLLYYSVSVRHCSPVLDVQHVPSVPESGSEHDWRPSHDRSSHSVHREAHLCAAFSRHLARYDPLLDRPAVLRWECVDDLERTQPPSWTVTAQLGFLLTTLLLDIKYDTTDRFM